MKISTIVAAGLLLSCASAASAGEPVRLTDQALDTVTAGQTAFAVGFTLGSFSSGKSGSTFEQSRSFASFQQQSLNGVQSSKTQLAASSTFTAVGSGPGSTAASGAGGVILGLF